MIEYTTAELVASHLQLATADELARQAAAAVKSLLDGRDDLTELNEDGDRVPTPAAALGATMLAAKLHRRRNSPYGTEAIDGTVASYVARADNEIARLLGIDTHALPTVG